MIAPYQIITRLVKIMGLVLARLTTPIYNESGGDEGFQTWSVS